MRIEDLQDWIEQAELKMFAAKSDQLSAYWEGYKNALLGVMESINEDRGDINEVKSGAILGWD